MISLEVMHKLLLLLFIPVRLMSQNVTVAEPSSWINVNEVTREGESTESGSIHYFLLDYQDNVSSEEMYAHIAYQVLNDEGVQSYSTISLDFDPSYQKLTFHKVLIKRKGQIINKLRLTDINTIQRENDMNRYLYDGSLTSFINLTDVRAGDIIEYSYTLTGFNPAMDGNYASSYYQDYSVPVDRVHVRLISDRNIYSKGLNDALDLQQSGNEYVLDVTPEYVQHESNTPNWYYPYRILYLSTFEKWDEVAKWATPLYSLNESEISNIYKEISKEVDFDGTTEENIVKAIRYVQDEIRYLGFESGIKGYQPHDPELVLERRFGDCKDKSNLLVAILRSIDVDANPMLVNSYKKHALDWEQPSPYSFDHCVVKFEYADRAYYVDPTINNQGGSVENLQFPNYERGLILDPDTRELTKIERKQLYKQLVEETLEVRGTSLDSNVSLSVRTTYYDASADNTRTYFENNSFSEITSNYTTFYANLYPYISSTDQVKIEDLSRNTDNIVVVEEQYEIEKFWSEYQENGLLGEAYALVLENYLSSKVPIKRTMPYYLGGPLEVEERIKLIMPEDWNVSSSKMKIEDNGFYYESEASGEGNEIDLTFILKLDSSYLSASSAAGFLEKRDEILDDLSFNVSYGTDTNEVAGISWWALSSTILAFLASIWVARNIHNNYNPERGYTVQYRQIGGWLVLLAIGLTLSPFRMAYGYADFFEYWKAVSWQNLELAYGDRYPQLSVLIISELVFNAVFIVFSIVVVIVFYQRRTSAPTLITYFFILNLAFIIIDAALAQLILEDESLSESIAEIVRSLIFTTIWVAYLNNSTRVKTTFTRIYKDGALVEVTE